MRFELDDTAEAVVQAVNAVLDAEGVSRSGGVLDDGSAQRVWKALRTSGVLALSVPARLGGEGLGVLPSLVVLTELGRRGLALPALATLATGVLPVVRWGTPQQQDDLLDGAPILTAALREPSSPPVPGTTITPELVLHGTKIGVPYADRARTILVTARLGDRTVVALLDPASTGVTLTRTPSSSGAPEWTVTLDGAVASGLLGGDERAAQDLESLALAGACALGDGAVSGALALTSAHVGSRVQFGRRLAEFQAVAQQMADVYIAARTLHLATISGCWRLHAGLEASVDLDVAAFWLAHEAPAALRTCHHLHGGLGLDVTYPLHRFSALVKDLVRAVGGVEHRLDSLGASLERDGELAGAA